MWCVQFCFPSRFEVTRETTPRAFFCFAVADEARKYFVGVAHYSEHISQVRHSSLCLYLD